MKIYVEGAELVDPEQVINSIFCCSSEFCEKLYLSIEMIQDLHFYNSQKFALRASEATEEEIVSWGEYREKLEKFFNWEYIEAREKVRWVDGDPRDYWRKALDGQEVL